MAGDLGHAQTYSPSRRANAVGIKAAASAMGTPNQFANSWTSRRQLQAPFDAHRTCRAFFRLGFFRRSAALLASVAGIATRHMAMSAATLTAQLHDRLRHLRPITVVIAGQIADRPGDAAGRSSGKSSPWVQMSDRVEPRVIGVASAVSWGLGKSTTSGPGTQAPYAVLQDGLRCFGNAGLPYQRFVLQTNTTM